jgi:hypothetical protein
VPGTLERYQLPAEVQERLEVLRKLSKKAEAGDEDARKELKQAVRESSPAVIARASDVGRKAQHLLIQSASGGDLLIEYALSGRLDASERRSSARTPRPWRSSSPSAWWPAGCLCSCSTR